MFDDDELYDDVIPDEWDAYPYDGRNPCEPRDTEDVWTDEEFPFNVMFGDEDETDDFGFGPDEIDFDD